jgi:hypothetical protein
MFAESSRSLALASTYYAFGSRISPWKQIPVSIVVGLPLFRRALALRIDYRLPCGWENWLELYRALRLPGVPGKQWAFVSRQGRYERFGAFRFDSRGRVEHYVEAIRDDFGFWPEPTDETPFRVPAVLAEARVGEWRLRALEPLPRLHRAPRLDARQLEAVCSGIHEVTGSAVARPAGAPNSWVPIHGDFAPWNLRQGRGDDLWLLDWEAVTWGPESADHLYFRLNEESIRTRKPDRLARSVSHALGEVDPVAARFWLTQPIFSELDRARAQTKPQRMEVARLQMVTRVLRRFAEQ